MKNHYVIAVASFGLLLFPSDVPAPLWGALADRHTDKGSAVKVARGQYSFQEKLGLTLWDKENLKTFPEAQLLVWSGEFDYARNCHDFAWAPWMACDMCGLSVPQREAWWMGFDDVSPSHPSENWKDGSMVNVVASVMKGTPGPEIAATDYLFLTADLNWLPMLYYNEWVQMVPLPTCPIDNLVNGVPAHSAILVGWFTPPSVSADYSAGIFVSKWGHGGVYMHRWGEGHCPPGYYDTDALRIFAPRQQWQPPYFIVYTAWGDLTHVIFP